MLALRIGDFSGTWTGPSGTRPEARPVAGCRPLYAVLGDTFVARTLPVRVLQGLVMIRRLVHKDEDVRNDDVRRVVPLCALPKVGHDMLDTSTLLEGFVDRAD